MRVTINNINKAIADLGYELIKGDGYFYFFPLTIETTELWESGVYTMHLTSHTVDEWRSTLEDKIEETRKEFIHH